MGQLSVLAEVRGALPDGVRDTGGMDAVAGYPQDHTGGPEATVHGDLAGQLWGLARSLQDETDFEETLATMVSAARDLIPGAAESSISVVEARRTVRSHASSSDLPAIIDRLQEKYR